MFARTKGAIAPLHSNHGSNIPNDPTPADQAIYVPSITPGYSMDVAQAILNGGWHRPLSHGVTPQEMSFLGTDTRKDFTLSHVLYSAGQALNKKGPCMIRDRKRGFSKVIGDSAGYQVANGTGDIVAMRDRARILKWLEDTADIAMTLDIPPGKVGRDPEYRYTSVEQCLTETLDHLRFFADNRRRTDMILLNVIQGNDSEHGFHWYNQVQRFDFEGYAIAGLMRNDIYYVCRLLIRIINDGNLQNKRWLHVLGTARLDTAVLLTAIQRALYRCGFQVRISYDTASPFLTMSKNRAYTFPDFGKKHMTYRTAPAPYGAAYHDCGKPWPWPSEIGNRLLMKDLCVDEGTTHRNSTQRDSLGNHLLSLHNLQSICFAINTANRVLDAEMVGGRYSIAEAEAEVAVAIDEILAEGTEAPLYRHRDACMKLQGVDGDGIDEFTSEELRNP